MNILTKEQSKTYAMYWARKKLFPKLLNIITGSR